MVAFDDAIIFRSVHCIADSQNAVADIFCVFGKAGRLYFVKNQAKKVMRTNLEKRALIIY
jgi:hypothetical protein